jgi:hypothetical protein
LDALLQVEAPSCTRRQIIEAADADHVPTRRGTVAAAGSCSGFNDLAAVRPRATTSRAW